MGVNVPYTRLPLLPLLPLLLLLLLGAAVSAQPATRTGEKPPFVLVKSLPDGELQRIVRWNGLCAKETIGSWGKTYLTLREVWLDELSVKLNHVYEERVLTDCTEEPIKADEDVCGSQLAWASGSTAESQVKFQLSLYANDTSQADVAIPAEFPWLQVSADEMRRRCAATTPGKPAVPPQQKQQRSKRGIRELVIAPGTKWCGPHRLAYSYKDLGALDGLDRCCRRHDHCPKAIAPFSQRYGLFNYMPFTLSHCGCDERFRTCLKMTGTSSANLIGKIFFNMVQTKCFTLKPAKMCVKRSWWGKCEKHTYKKQAYLRDNIYY